MGHTCTSENYTIDGIGFKDLADVGIIIESYRILETIIKLDYKFQKISSYHLDYDWFLFQYKTVRVAFAVSQGAAMVVDLAERFHASGIKYIVRIGTIGALISNLKLGDFIIPYASIRDEGTSGFYLDVKSPALADIDFTQALSIVLRGKGYVVHNGIVWSTDGRWKESNEAIRSRISDGSIGTDMESSALFAFGINRRVPVASISVLSDEICDSGDEYKGLSDKEIWFNKVLPKMPVAFNAIIETVSTLFNNNTGKQ